MAEFTANHSGFPEMTLLPKKPCKSKAKGLLLGALFTSFLLLLYSYVVPPLYPNMAFTTSEAAAPCSPIPNEPVAATPANGSAGGCQPRRDIVFMKTHKTASSTLLNILFRFGQKHELKFAFPNGRNDFHYPSYFARSLVQDYRPGACFNIICNHMRFHYEEVRGLVRPGATFITVIRDPARLFESSFHYFGSVVPLTWKLSSRDKLDVRLYRHFNASFWRKVEAFGRERMAREVAELRQANEHMRHICIDGGQAVGAEAIQDSAMQPWQPLGIKSILGYNLKKSIGPQHEQLCRRMLTPEIQYLSDLGANLWVTKLWKFLRDFLRW